MKPVRSLIIFGTGIAAGIAIATRVDADEPEVLHGPSQRSGAPATRRCAPPRPGVARGGDRATSRAWTRSVAHAEMIREPDGPRTMTRPGAEPGYQLGPNVAAAELSARQSPR